MLGSGASGWRSWLLTSVSVRRNLSHESLIDAKAERAHELPHITTSAPHHAAPTASRRDRRRGGRVAGAAFADRPRPGRRRDAHGSGYVGHLPGESVHED